MFATFLLGLLLMTSLVMVALLAAPTRGTRADRLPVVGVVVGLMLAFLAILSGFAVAG